ncbi:MAG: AAA domain-containing protein, partial [Acholeplasmataceae bacterium]
TVLVASNNNKPISDIYEKMINLNNQNIILPFIRLGNFEETTKSLNYIKSILNLIKSQNIYEDRLTKIKGINSKEMTQINEFINNYERKLELEEAIEVLETTKEKLSFDLRSLIIDDLLNENKKELKEIGEINENELLKKIKIIDKSFYTWLRYTSFKHLKRIFEPKNENLLNIINHFDNDQKVSEFNKYLKDPNNFSNFQKIFPIILTTNQSAHRLGEQEENFDLAIIDEAGQSSIGYALFPISRAKRLLLVGDQNQLKPVITMSRENHNILIDKYEIGDNYNYLDNSILLTMQKVDTISKSILLRYHYRSKRRIINFSNQKYYNNQLILPIEDSLDEKALESININSANHPYRQRNTALLEIDAIIKDIKEKGYKDVGVITPFRNQANLLEDFFKQEKINGTVGTVHTFQGDQKDIIYLSAGITRNSYEKSFDWIKNNQELINVATTRAKNKFILVSDEREIKRRSVIKNDISELLNYVKNNGKEVTLSKSNQTYFINGANFRNFDTEKEIEFFETISHLLTTADSYTLRSKVRIISLFNKYLDSTKYDFALKGEFDLVIFKNIGKNQIPVVVIELDGIEHKEDLKVIRRDKIKESICLDNNIKLIRIDNKYSRRYLFIKDLLKEILK